MPGWLLGQIINRVRLAPGLYPLLAAAGALFTFALVSLIGGSGFLAVYLTGLVMGNRRLNGYQNIMRFQDGLTWLAQITMFLMLGLLVLPSALLAVAIPAIALGPASDAGVPATVGVAVPAALWFLED